MKILGICNTSDAGATLLIDGAVVASVNEERFSRIKNQRAFPAQAINYCLTSQGLDIAQIDYVVCGAWGGVDEQYLATVIAELLAAVVKNPAAQQVINDRTRVALERDGFFRRELREEVINLGVPAEKIAFYDHHLSHAYTAFYPSPFEEALVCTSDARGDFKSATISKASRQAGIELLDSTSMYHSLGFFYAFITRYLGFTPNKHEGKITGLAAFGNPEACLPVLRRMIGYQDEKTVANLGTCYMPFLSATLPEIERELARYSKADVAAGAQHLLEQTTSAYLQKYLQLTGLRQVCLAGGVFSNVKLNQRILALPEVDNIYVFPQMGDGGNAFGGALIKLYELGGTFNAPLHHVFLGPAFSRPEILHTLAAYQEQVTYCAVQEYTLQRVAQEIAAGGIIGLFTGRMEYGPRALGGRSIMARAIDHDVTAILNKRLNRSEFMPFAPVTLEDYADQYYVGWQQAQLASRFMTVCYACTDRAKRETPGIVHVDQTARPQIINAADNALYYGILKAYHDLTGIPTLINTSFNNHEEPIVCSPKDAIESLLLDNVDYVVLEEFIVKRNRMSQIA